MCASGSVALTGEIWAGSLPEVRPITFSIVIPVFNRLRELERAIRSCLNQTYHHFELIVVDDCSTENVQSLCDGFQDNRIVYKRNVRRSGASDSRNDGVSIARGDYICFLDSDDVYLPGKLGRIVGAIETTRPALIVHQQLRVVATGPSGLTAERMPSSAPGRDENVAEFIFRSGNFVQTNSFAVRRDLAQTLRFGGRYRLWDDTQYFLEAHRRAGEMIYMPVPLSIFFDLPDTRRVSQSREFEQHREFLTYLAEQHSERAVVYFNSLAVSDAIFWRSPIHALRYICQGLFAGVSLRRSGFYLLRCLIGYNRAKRATAFVKRKRVRLSGNDVPDRELADLVRLPSLGRRNGSGPQSSIVAP